MDLHFRLWGIPFHQLPSYLSDGTACFLNMGTVSSGCERAPLLPILFCIVNMAYNISLLHLIKISSAVVSCLASTVSGIICTLCSYFFLKDNQHFKCPVLKKYFGSFKSWIFIAHHSLL